MRNMDVQQKKRLQLDFEEVQAAHALSQQNFIAELQVEREKSKCSKKTRSSQIFKPADQPKG